MHNKAYMTDKHGDVDEIIGQGMGLMNIADTVINHVSPDGKWHCSPVVGNLCSSMKSYMFMVIAQETLEQGVEALGDDDTELVVQQMLGMSFEIGYIAAQYGMQFEPCLCDLSREVIDHVNAQIIKRVQGF
jgi:hypothetical protein